MIRVQLQGIEKLQRVLDADRFDRALFAAATSIQSQAENIVKSAAPQGRSKQTSGRGFARSFKSRKVPTLSGLIIGSKAAATPKRYGVRGGKYKVPYPYPRLLEYSPKSKYRGWLKRASKRVTAALRPELRKVLAEMRRGL